MPTTCAATAIDARPDLKASGTVPERASIWRDDVAFAPRNIGSANVAVLVRDGAPATSTECRPRIP